MLLNFRKMFEGQLLQILKLWKLL